MSQEIYELQSPEFVAKTIPKLHKSILAALSNLSGDIFPTNNLEVGMLCFRTDTSCFYVLEDVAKKKWTKVIDLRNAFGNADMLDGKHAIDFAPSGFGISEPTDKLENLNVHLGGLFAVNTNCANAPSTDYGFLVAIRLDSNKTFQAFAPLGSADATLKGKIYTRVGVGALWSSWTSVAVTNGSSGKISTSVLPGSVVVVSTSAPTDKSLMWVNSTLGQGTLNYWDGTAWVPVIGVYA